MAQHQSEKPLNDYPSILAALRRETETQGVAFHARVLPALARILAGEDVELGSVAIMAAVYGLTVGQQSAGASS